MEALFCMDCKATTQNVLDHATGDIICTECALVLESHFINDTPEWRTFTNDDSKDNDPVRVEQATTTSTLLGKCDLSTVISLPNGTEADFLLGSLAWKQSCGPNSDQSLINGFTTIADMVDSLGLVPTIC